MASSSDVESPPLTPLLVSADENMSDKSTLLEETFEHQLDDIDTNDGIFLLMVRFHITISTAYQLLSGISNVSRSGMKEKMWLKM